MTPKPKKRSKTPPKKEQQQKQTEEPVVAKQSAKEQPESLKDSLVAAITEAKTEVEKFKTKLAYVQAEYQNYIKSAEKREVQLRLQANRDLLLRLLPILDDLERAQIMVPNIEVNEPFKRGLQMVIDNLKSAFTDAGVTPIICENQVFDPLRHEAVVREETTMHPPNTILEELRKGYLLKGELLRPTMVKIAITPKPVSSKVTPSSESHNSVKKTKPSK